MRILMFTVALLTVFSVIAEDGFFKWDVSRESSNVRVSVTVSSSAYLYENTVILSLKDDSGKQSETLKKPSAVSIDSPDGKEHVYMGPGVFEWIFSVSNMKYPLVLKVDYQGCRKDPFLCFAPDSFNAVITENAITKDVLIPSAFILKSESALDEILAKFKMVSSASGYMDKAEFSDFLSQKNEDKNMFAGKGFFLTVLLVILGGLALNLTPCVLPMIPVNLAIIGAGNGSDSRFSGLAKGSAYGAGIALAYGALGILVLFTGTRFGALNSSSIFNFVVAAIFVILALAMFDIINIDFSRYGAKLGPSDSQKGKLFAAFFLGIVAALLAGACVAPVVIATLVYSSTLYASGNYLGLILPFLLGAGMALPWPLAGAGMAVLPKPGRWMLRIKYVFGILIIILALYYVYVGYTLLPISSQKEGFNAGIEIKSLSENLEKAYSADRPVVIDFWASWCKNCVHMENTTFRDPEVREKLKEFSFLKFQAEKPSDPEIKSVLDAFKITGFPTYIILRPEKSAR